VRRSALAFWGSAVLAAAVFAALVPVLFPFRALGLDRGTDLARIWLLTVFCAGVMAVLFGASGLLGTRLLGVRDVIEAESARTAVERHRASVRASRERGWRNAGGWTVAAGASLIAIYFILMAVLA
jgi:hypothetical protein